MIGRIADGLSFDNSVEEAITAIQSKCKSYRTIVIEPPVLPVAEHSETHVHCQLFALDSTTIQQLILTFADDGLSFLYAAGNAVDPLIGLVDGSTNRFLDYDASFEDLFLARRGTDEAWLLSPEAAHVGLFQWSHFLADRRGDAVPSYDPSVDVPEFLVFGEELGALRAVLGSQCTQVSERTTDTWLLTGPKEQYQVDCFGYEFGGFPRKIEAVFGDGILEQAWLLTSKAEESRLLGLLIETYGEPEARTDSWYVFANASLMLRTDKPEILFVSERLAPLYLDEISR